MRKKILFGFFIIALIAVNLTLNIQNKNAGVELSKLFNMSFANAEETCIYKVIPGGDIGSQTTTTYNCPDCGHYSFELTVQPISFDCQEGGSEGCPSSMARIISASCWYC